MSQNDFKFMKSSISDENEDGDNITLVNGEERPTEVPSSVMYIPTEGRFSNDSKTLVEESEGSSSKDSLKGSLEGSLKNGLNSSIQQLQYNGNKVALDRAINQSVELLSSLTNENKQRPIFYPTDIEDDNQILLNSRRAHLALVRNFSNSKPLSKSKIAEEDQDIPDFKVLKLNVKIGHNNQSNENIMSSLDKKAIATLLNQKFGQQIKYLLNLKDRIDNTSSKVFVTGDLNSGKSTFCNALLRRKILPEDQQPCTSVFCEVIDALQDNNGVEEVHAVPIGQEYAIRDESTYEVFPLASLEELVYECDKYSILNIYVLDSREFHESLLHNGVIDIKLIDAPGLNMDSYQTTQVFSRQEEIDLVVFVVSSENHFTLSAKEFIAAAAAEKQYVFIVVNRFDNIRDKEKCKARILDQVKNLSPDTYKSAKDFVHFVSSTDVLNDSSGNEFPDDGSDPDDNDNNDDHNTNPDFDHLESSLRKFILEKRAVSKLLPAKNYLNNLLTDLEALSAINEKIYFQEKNEKLIELNNQINPKFDKIMMNSNKISEKINHLMEYTCNEVYEFSKNDILTTLENFGDHQVISYQGFQYLYEYAKETQRVMIGTVVSCVLNCEEKTKILTTEKVGEITMLGQRALGDDFLTNSVFKPELMFTKKKNAIKNLDIPIEFSDFFDPSWDSCLMWLGIPKDYINSTKNQLSYFNPLSVLSYIPASANNLKNSLSTQVTLHTIYSSGKLLTTGAIIRKLYSASYFFSPSLLKKVSGPVLLGVTGFAIYYLINDIPNAFPRKQARKIKQKVYEIDYPHSNANRISKECRTVLNYPSRQVMNCFQTSIDKSSSEKASLEKVIEHADFSFRYFRKLLKEIQFQKDLLNEIDIESINVVD